MALFYVLHKLSIPNYPAKLGWVNLMPFVKYVNVDSYLPCGSRLKNEVLTCTFPFLSSVFIFTAHAYMFLATKMQAVTITIIRCNCRMETTRHVVNKSIRSPNRTNRPNQQTCKGHCH